MTAAPDPIDPFIARWQGREGGQERANYALFLSELCSVLGLKPPDPAGATRNDNDYVFERHVQGYDDEGNPENGRIDLYKRGCFVLEAKQSRAPGGRKERPDQTILPGFDPPRRGVRTAARAWDVLMLNARRQAEGYARALPTDHGWPPFILVCDVGHVIELFADFSGQGKNYAQFPDRQSFRVYLEDLRDPDIRNRLRKVWTEPRSLDPAREAARVTRDIAERLAAVSRALEAQRQPAETVAMFLMRCLFTMFAEDIGLLPHESFRDLLRKCEQDPSRMQPMVSQLWEAMDKGDFAFALEAKVPRFNGEFFKDRTVLKLGREEIGELRRAAEHDWKDVDPSIFGTLLEQALDKTERKQLGAHYTPRAYVERLVVATVIEPLRADWNTVLTTALRQKSEGRADRAIATVRAFHEQLCRTRVLDPACGSGNFLYVSLELLKRLEGEVLEALADLGGQEVLVGLRGHTVDPHQFLGLELNPRAAAIAELVLWIGYLQWHKRTSTGMPDEPILRAFHNIERRDAVLEADISFARGQGGDPATQRGPDGREVEIYRYRNPRKAKWPEAEYIVGNPPFIGSKFMRSRLTDNYVEALWAAHEDMNESADFVMYWWNNAATLLTEKMSVLRRFGFVTTNSITQSFQSQVVRRHLKAKAPVSLVIATPDHPWIKSTSDAAVVRIAMTVVEAGSHEGTLLRATLESGLDTDTPIVEFREETGIINSDLTVGADVNLAIPLRANEGISSPGVKLHGAGFIVSRRQAEALGLGRRAGLDNYIREYRHGRDLTLRPRGVLVIDLFGLTADDTRDRFPEVYQYLKVEVKEKITAGPNGEQKFIGRDWNNRDSYKEQWWIFGEPRTDLRAALAGLRRYVVTPVTPKHRTFSLLSNVILPDDALMCFALDDSYHLGVLQSFIHCQWVKANAASIGGYIGDVRYIKSRCFDPFPFPAADDLQKQRIRRIAEDLDTHRKRVLADHPHLTLTGLYNVLERIRAGTQPADLTPDERRIFDDGLVLILKEHHDNLDQAVAAAYGWPADLPEAEILARLVALNQERTREEAAGQVRWLRPDYQIPRFGSTRDRLDLAGGAMRDRVEATATGKSSFPTDDRAQTVAVMAALAAAPGPMTRDALAATFRQGRRVAPQIEAVLASLVRMGGFVTSPDGGRSFALRRAA